MNPLQIRPLTGTTSDVAEKIDALNSKPGSFIHAPLNLKEVLRMEPFTADAEVMRAVAATLDNYTILPTPPKERECQRTTVLPKEKGDTGDMSAGRNKFPKIEQAVEEALAPHRYDGDVNDSLASGFCSGRWKALDAEEWQGNFAADLHQRPLQPVKVHWNRFCSLVYSPEIDFYAALYYIPPIQCWMLLGGRNPLETN